MDQPKGDRDSAQTPAKDFLALTHGQEWVSFYESFDLLVQDHLSRSSELLRKAMSLPEVADREVAQVRAEMDVKLSAERKRSLTLLSQLHGDISLSSAHVATLAESVQSVSAGLSSLSTRVADALAALSASGGSAVTSDADVSSESADDSSRAIAADDDDSEEITAADDSAKVDVVAEASDEAPIEANAVTEVAADNQPEIAAERVLTEEEEFAALLAEVEAEAAADSAAAATAREGAANDVFIADADGAAEQPVTEEHEVDLSAPLVAESDDDADEHAALSDELVVEAERPQTGMFDEDAVGAGASDRPRPHWLSVTRIGSRP